MAAKVRPGDRKKTGMKGGRFPVATKDQADSAIRLRGKGKGITADAVLTHVDTMAKKMGWPDIQAKVKKARKAGKKK